MDNTDRYMQPYPTLDQITALGFKVIGSRYPFTYHHDFVRLAHPEASRSEVALQLGRYQAQKGEQKYIATVFLGALGYLFHEQPSVALRVCGSLYPYAEHALEVLGQDTFKFEPSDD